uniref:Transmembrane protein n=1 Tax=Steinernema glaseri TaxID=37863 RepID=A0A1I7ZGQ6_9BILA
MSQEMIYIDSTVGMIVGCVMIIFAVLLCFLSQMRTGAAKYSRKVVGLARSRLRGRPRQSVFSVSRGEGVAQYTHV